MNLVDVYATLERKYFDLVETMRKEKGRKSGLFSCFT